MARRIGKVVVATTLATASVAGVVVAPTTYAASAKIDPQLMSQYGLTPIAGDIRYDAASTNVFVGNTTTQTDANGNPDANGGYVTLKVVLYPAFANYGYSGINYRLVNADSIINKTTGQSLSNDVSVKFSGSVVNMGNSNANPGGTRVLTDATYSSNPGLFGSLFSGNYVQYYWNQSAQNWVGGTEWTYLNDQNPATLTITAPASKMKDVYVEARFGLISPTRGKNVGNWDFHNRVILSPTLGANDVATAGGNAAGYTGSGPQLTNEAVRQAALAAENKNNSSSGSGSTGTGSGTNTGSDAAAVKDQIATIAANADFWAGLAKNYADVAAGFDAVAKTTTSSNANKKAAQDAVDAANAAAKIRQVTTVADAVAQLDAAKAAAQDAEKQARIAAIEAANAYAKQAK
ncbi:MAG: hypothetical protein Q3976_10485, partial [Corynebacterium sp.]|nr:hypothetical protein [Corynebacterium sp.]